MKIKICGMKGPENIREVAGLQPDFMGFILYQESPRFIQKNILNSSLTTIPSTIQKTGVFVNELLENVLKTGSNYSLDLIQLHGNETAQYCQLASMNIPVMKAFALHDHFDFDEISAFQPSCTYFLFDTKTNGYGGSGKTFEWKLIEKYKLDTPFFLSGGIGLKNIETALHISHPMFYGVDLNSKLETSPGIKNIGECKKIIELIRHYEHI
ncbi:MAG: phosphoribosylanthranilate isomerase [Saprospiraceae bacterium]